MNDTPAPAPIPQPQPAPNDGGTASSGDVVAVGVESCGVLLDLVGGLLSLFR